MPDIAMCHATDCTRSKECYRHEDSGTKPDEYRQTYFQTPPYKVGVDQKNNWFCDYFWRYT